MAGGIGSRFWPMSSDDQPKQFLDILGTGKSLLRLTFERFNYEIPAENILILTNSRYKNQVIAHIPECPAQNILLEPSRNNTAPCIAYAALKLNKRNPNSSFCVAPSDAVIADRDQFLVKLNEAFDFVEKNEAIVTLGIEPERPDTGYGYIEVEDRSSDITKVSSFKEKPDRHTAEAYLKSGNYFWNAGIFIWSTSTILNSFRRNEAQILNTLSEDLSKFDGDEEQEYIDRVYPQCKKISVDYAILEKDPNIFTIPADIGWSDLGTWNSLYSFLEKDADRNVIQTSNAKVLDSEGCFIKVPGDKEVLIKGLKDFIVVDSPDGLLIYPKSDEQEIKTARNKD